MVDFFSLQNDALARSRKFYLAFSLAIFLAVVLLYFAISGVFLIFALPESSLLSFIYGDRQKVLSLRPFLIIGTAIALTILIISSRRNRFISECGGAYIAEMLQARPLERPANLKERQLLNVVEEMAIAAGLPRPRLYIIPGLRSINAITAGVDHDDAIIAITEGAVKHLDRDELQGVIAHELAHILNGDFSLNLTMAGWLYGLMFFYVQGRRFLFFVGDGFTGLGDRDNMPAGCILCVRPLIAAALLMAAGWVGKTLAQILQAAFSRQREYLADAFAVQFTRNPKGLAGALKKIAWAPRRGFIESADALTVEAFFIASPNKAEHLFKSLPPLEERILSLDPAWDGEARPIEDDDFRPPKNLNEKYAYGPSRSAAPKSLSTPRRLFAEKVKNMDGWSGLMVLSFLEAGEGGKAAEAGASLKAAHELYEGIPAPLLKAVHEAAQVGILTASVFVQGEEDTRKKQRLALEKHLGDEGAAMALGFESQMSLKQRLPLLDLALPAIKGLPWEEKTALISLIKNLAAADGRLDLFEIAACQVLKKSLGNIFQPGAADKLVEAAAYPGKVRQHVVKIMSLLASFDVDEGEAGKVFSEAMKAFNQWPPQEMLPKGRVGSKALVESLDYLAKAPFKVRNSLIMAATQACLQKEIFSEKQYQLLRALAAALEMPLPITDIFKA